MLRRIFISFHYERDAWRASQIRDLWLTQNGESADFWDPESWETVQRKGEGAVNRWIDSQLEGTSVTVVLIGAETSQQPYVDYEIKASHERSSGLLGIYINRMEDASGRTDVPGSSPFDNLFVQLNRRTVPLSEIYPTYDWESQNGRQNLVEWIDEAARKAGR